jgi:hypothetical protein
MPRVSTFYGIAIWLYWDDHQPPHFHAEYSGRAVLLTIDGLEVVRGSLPLRAMRLVEEWARLHLHELQANWEKAQLHEPLVPIDPLP